MMTDTMWVKRMMMEILKGGDLNTVFSIKNNKKCPCWSIQDYCTY